MRKFLILLCFLVLPATAAAQTHPCDQPPAAQPTIQSGAPYRASFCALQSDKVEAALATVDSTAFDLLPLVLKTPTPSVSGKVLYETASFIQVPKGAHTLTIALYNKNTLTGLMQLGPASPPFPFAADDDTPKPAAAEIKGVVK